MAKLKVGIIGLFPGSPHVRIFHDAIQETEVSALCNLDEARMKQEAEKNREKRLEEIRQLDDLQMMDWL